MKRPSNYMGQLANQKILSLTKDTNMKTAIMHLLDVIERGLTLSGFEYVPAGLI